MYLALVGDGLVTSHGEKWKFHRQLLTPLFHMKTLKEMQQMMVLYTNDLLATLEQSSGEWLPGLETFGAYTLSQIIMLAFGGLIDVNRLVAKQQEQGKQFGQYIKMRNLFGNIYKYLPVPSTLKLFSLKAQIAEQAKSVIRQVRSELERKQKNGELDENNALHTDLLRTMVEARHPKTGEPVSEQEIIDEATTLLFAGFDTTAVTLSWALYRLSMDSRVQDKLAAFVNSFSNYHPFILLLTLRTQ
jgi:cytochrome P450